MSVSDINRNVLIAFVERFNTANFTASFSSNELSVKPFSEHSETTSAPTEKESMERMEFKSFRRKYTLNQSQFLKSKNLAHCRLRTMKLLQVFTVSMTGHSYAMKASRSPELYLDVCCNRNLPVTLLNGAHFLQLVLYNNEAKERMPNEMSMPTAFEANLYFHSTFFGRREAGRNKLNISGNAVNSTVASIEFQLVYKAQDALTWSCLLAPLRVLEPYSRLNPSVIQFQALSLRLDGFRSLKQQ